MCPSYALGAFGAPGIAGAPGGFGAPGAAGAPGALGELPGIAAISPPHSLHAVAFKSFMAPHLPHRFSVIAAGLKHMVVFLSLRPHAGTIVSKTPRAIERVVRRAMVCRYPSMT